MIPACTVLAEAERVDVGRGVAVLDRRARVTSSLACTVDLGASTLAREQGRGAPELVAARIVWNDVDDVGGGAPTAVRLVGPRAALTLDLPAGTHLVRLRAVLRGERFCLVPLAMDPATRPRAAVTASARATSVWGAHGISGLARWIEVGVPIVIETDPARDHEPLTLVGVVGDADVGSPALVVDAGPRFDAGPAEATEDARRAALAGGGVRALAVLLSDLPLSIATAPDDARAIDRLGETARAALAASRSADVLVAAVGQRLSTALATAFTTCTRAPTVHLPAGWPQVDPRWLETGLLADADAGCPRVADRIAEEHPALSLEREAAAALAEAAAGAPSTGPASDLPSIAPFGPRPARLHPIRPRRRRWAPFGLLAAALLVLLGARRITVARAAG